MTGYVIQVTLRALKAHFYNLAIFLDFIVTSRLVMAALCNSAGHYIFALWFLSSSFFLFSFFPRLISAAADWMSTILWHIVWPECEFRMQV